MPGYTNPWSDTDPPGSQNANTIDDEFRQLRLDIHERMDDIVDDWTDDPVVLSGAAGSIGSSERCDYLDASPGGNKAANLVDIKSHMFVAYVGTTGSGGGVLININEISILTGIVWNITTHGLNIILMDGRRTSGQVPVFMTVVGASGITNIFTLQFQYGDGALVNNVPINCTFLITAQVTPT